MTDSQLALLARARKGRAHVHDFQMHYYSEDGVLMEAWEACYRCKLTRADFEARQKRGRSSLRAGKDAERAIAKSYGGKRTGQFGGPDDVVVGDLFIVQSKAGRGWFREAVWAELAKLTGSQRIPTLVISDRPGPGRKTRRYVIRTLEDDVALHGEKP